MNVLSDLELVGSVGGLSALIIVIIREFLSRGQRAVDVEAAHVNADTVRMDIADRIASRLQEQINIQSSRINLLEQQEQLLIRKIYLLERTLIHNGIELPYETDNN